MIPNFLLPGFNRYILLGIVLFIVGFFLSPFLIGIPIMLVGWMVGIFGVFYYYYHFIPGHDRLTNKIKDFGRRYLQELGFSKTQPSKKDKKVWFP